MYFWVRIHVIFSRGPAEPRIKTTAVPVTRTQTLFPAQSQIQLPPSTSRVCFPFIAQAPTTSIMTSSTPPSPLPPDVDRSTPLQTSFWVPFAFTVPVLIARFYVRIARKRLGIDDWFMLIGWILYTVALALSSALVARGATRHIWYLSPGDTLAILKLQMLGQAIGIPGFCFAKLSVALLLTRLLDDTSRWRKWFLYLHIFVYFALGITVVGLLFGQCRPARALWEPHLLADGATCPLTEPYNRVGQTHSGKLSSFFDYSLHYG